MSVKEIVGLLGPNGAGKQLLHHRWSIKPNTGEVLIDNTDITSFPMYQRAQNGIGYLAQEASAFVN